MFIIPESWYKIKNVKKKGRGVFAMRDIEVGTVIGDYVGTIMRPQDENERKNGLYTMSAGERFDILGDPKVKGVHLINHSCANNCDTYPYRGHILLIATRKIFKGEEFTINYSLYGPEEKKTTCAEHTCYCGSRFCTGTMHSPASIFDGWEAFVRKQFGSAYNRVPGNYGDQMPLLEAYPESIKKDYPDIYDVFASEKKTPLRYGDKSFPSLLEIRKRIRESGRPVLFPKLHVKIDGIRSGVLLTERV